MVNANISKICKMLESNGDHWESVKTSSLIQLSGRKHKHSRRDRRIFTLIVWNNQKSTAPEITAGFNDHLEKTVRTTVILRELQETKFQRRAWIWGHYIQKQTWLSIWIGEKILQIWSLDQWNNIIFSDETPYTSILTTGRVDLWKQSKEASDYEHFITIIKRRGPFVGGVYLGNTSVQKFFLMK